MKSFLKFNTRKCLALLLVLLMISGLISCVRLPDSGINGNTGDKAEAGSIPAFSGSPYTILNGNKPNFSKDELKTVGYETYSRLDSLGRCGTAIASCGIETMPAKDEDRESISSVIPTGWVQATYDTSLVSGGYLYNRCHLIGWQLSAENANEMNIITGTKYLNIHGMLPFENMIADYIKETKNHVAYRVTPVFEGNELVCRGVKLEAYSIEDKGEGICFNVYCYNVQPGIFIDYSTGESRLEGSAPSESGALTDAPVSPDGYVLNTNSKKIHLPTCRYAKDMNEKNKEIYNGNIEDIIAEGYEKCKTCFD